MQKGHKSIPNVCFLVRSDEPGTWVSKFHLHSKLISSRYFMTSSRKIPYKGKAKNKLTEPSSEGRDVRASVRDLLLITWNNLLQVTVTNLTLFSTVQNPCRASKPQDPPAGAGKFSAVAHAWLPDPPWGTWTLVGTREEWEAPEQHLTPTRNHTHTHTHTPPSILSGNCLVLVNNPTPHAPRSSSGTRELNNASSKSIISSKSLSSVCLQK